MVVAHGLPSFVAYGVYLGEVVAPVFLLLGIRSRIAAGVIVIDMGVALWLAHAGALLKFGKEGGLLIELPLLYLVSALAVLLLGSGRYALRPD
jgi:putative oxidoreductase